jgi:general secretion pathway protein B
MSLILEALRKSEAERRRAAVPDLLAEPQAATPVATHAPQRLPWMLAGGAVAIALAWMVLANRSPAPASVAPGEDDAVATQALVEAAAPAQPTQAARPSPQVQRPLVVAAPAPAKPAVQTQLPATQAAAPKSESVALDTPPPRLAPPVVAAAPPPAPAVDTTQRVTDLGGDERKQLPALKLSMHMWNDDAAQRFVIIDGTRLRVGDHLGALVVADILPDGVLLDWNGRPLKLPLR